MVETETTLEERLQTQWYQQRPHWKNSYKPYRRNRDHDWDCNCSYGVVSVSTIGFVTVLPVWSLFIPLVL
jgi:hypothetical protein